MEVRERSTSSWSSGCTRVKPETPTQSASDRPNMRCADELPQATLPSSSTMTTLSGSFNMAPAREATSSIDGAASVGGAPAAGAATRCASAAEAPRAGACCCPRLFSRQVPSLLSDISARSLVAIWLHRQENSGLHRPLQLELRQRFRGRERGSAAGAGGHAPADAVDADEQVGQGLDQPRPLH